MSGPYCMTGAFGSRIGEHIDQCGNSTWLRAEDLEARGLPTVLTVETTSERRTGRAADKGSDGA